MNFVYFGDAANEFSNRHYLALERACRDTAARERAPVMDRDTAPGARGAVRAAGCRIVGVVDSPKSGWVSTRQGGADASPPFDRLAQERGIPVLRPHEPNSPEAIAALEALGPELFVAVGYTRRLGPALLALPRLGAVNFHASLLPAYRGKHPVFWALYHGERSAGLTVHLMEPRLDAGDILYRVRVRTRVDDSVARLYERIMSKSVGLMARLLADAEDCARGAVPGRRRVRQGAPGGAAAEPEGPVRAADRLKGRPQEEAASSYYSSPGDEDLHLSWSMPAQRIVRRASAIPGRFWLTLQGRRVSVLEASRAAFPENSGRNSKNSGRDDRRRDPRERCAGVVLELGRRDAVIAASDGAVRLRRLADETGVELPAAETCRSAGLAAGDSWEE